MDIHCCCFQVSYYCYFSFFFYGFCYEYFHLFFGYFVVYFEEFVSSSFVSFLSFHPTIMFCVSVSLASALMFFSGI